MQAQQAAGEHNGWLVAPKYVQAERENQTQNRRANNTDNADRNADKTQIRVETDSEADSETEPKLGRDTERQRHG